MSEIIDIQAPPEKVVNAMNQMTAAAQRFDGAVGGLGRREFHDPFLKGERAVSRASANMVTGLLNATSVSDALSNSLLQVEKGGRLGLGLAVGVAVGVAAFEALSKAIQKSHEVHDAAEKALSRPLGVQTGLDAAGIASQINATAAALAAEQKQNASFSEAALNTYLPTRMANTFLGIGGKGGGEENFDRELALNEKLNALAHAQGAEALRIAQFKKDALDSDERTVAYAKAELEFKNKVSSLKLAAQDNPALSAGYSDSYKALQMELEVAKEIADKKADKADTADLVQQEEDRASSEIANFQGTKVEKEDFATARNKERLQNEIDILHAYGMQEQEKKKILELDELSGKTSEKKKAETEKNDAEVKAATTSNQVTALQQSGQTFAANILKIREATEAKIAAHLREQKGDLAAQDAVAGQLELRQKLKQQLRDPQGNQARERAAAAQDQSDEAKIAYLEGQINRGVKFDKDDPSIQYLNQYKAAQEAMKAAAGGQKDDFSSVTSLAGKDFSSLSKLGEADFSGLQALADLQITIK